LDYVLWIVDNKLRLSPDVRFEEEPIPPDDELSATDLGFTIDGAARALASKHGVNEDAIREAIRSSVMTGALKVVDPQTRMRYQGAVSAIRNFYHRVRIVDLNLWLEQCEAPYRVETPEDDTASSGPTPVTRTRIMNGFTVKSTDSANVAFWDGKLSRPPAWLASAIVTKGKPGISSRWNPTLVAHALLGEGLLTLSQLDAAMEAFPDWQPSWREHTENDR